MARVRYLISDVDRSIAFYTKHLGFKLEQQSGPAFASVVKGDLTLLLSGPQSSGHRPLSDGRRQEPGGWNRFVLNVDNLASHVATLKQAGSRFTREITTVPGGNAIPLEKSDGHTVQPLGPSYALS